MLSADVEIKKGMTVEMGAKQRNKKHDTRTAGVGQRKDTQLLERLDRSGTEQHITANLGRQKKPSISVISSMSKRTSPAFTDSRSLKSRVQHTSVSLLESTGPRSIFSATHSVSQPFEQPQRTQIYLSQSIHQPIYS
jgi:hypothetical protein